MTDKHALDFFLWAASVCLIVLTLLAAIVAFVAWRAVAEARDLVRLVRKEVELYSRVRARISHSGKFVRAWVRAFGRRVIGD